MRDRAVFYKPELRTGLHHTLALALTAGTGTILYGLFLWSLVHVTPRWDAPHVRG